MLVSYYKYFANIWGGKQNIPELLKKKLFKRVVQVWKFGPLQSTPRDWMQWSEHSSHCWKLSKISNRNAVKGHQQFSVSLCNVSKTPPFWLKRKWWLRLPLLTWYSSILFFFCSQGWIRIWKGGILLTLKRFNNNLWWPFTEFLLKMLPAVGVLWRGLNFQNCTTLLNKFF